MQVPRLRPNMALAMIAFTVLFGVMLACARAIGGGEAPFFSVSRPIVGPAATQDAQAPAQAEGPLPTAAMPRPTAAIFQPRSGPILTPTPDSPHLLPPLRLEPDLYTVKAGDTLGLIAQKYGVSLQQVIDANQLLNPNLIPLGVVLNIPAPTPEGTGPDFKIIPDSELVYGPASAGFDIAGFVQSQGGYLANYREDIDDQPFSGAQIVERVAQEFSVNPRLLLSVLEYQSNWVTRTDPKPVTLDYPLRLRDPTRKGLYRQLAWTANQLNRGFYLWQVNGVPSWLTTDGSIVPIATTINAGTASVQSLFAALYNLNNWLAAVSPDGLFATYNALFGYPFNWSFEPLQPPGLQQPVLQLPFEPGKDWAFTGGPHGAWADGSAWAALDFAPPGDALGCVLSNDWVVAAADGLITRAGNGAVIQDLDGDGFEQTGWVIFYMHVESRDRVQPGTYLKAGERIGHPSCEGGVSTGTHLHIARKYNGEWIPADQKGLPFVMDGWTSSGEGNEYDGYLQRDGLTVEAYAGRSDTNSIQR